MPERTSPPDPDHPLPRPYTPPRAPRWTNPYLIWAAIIVVPVALVVLHGEFGDFDESQCTGIYFCAEDPRWGEVFAVVGGIVLLIAGWVAIAIVHAAEDAAARRRYRKGLDR